MLTPTHILATPEEEVIYSNEEEVSTGWNDYDELLTLLENLERRLLELQTDRQALSVEIDALEVGSGAFENAKAERQLVDEEIFALIAEVYEIWSSTEDSMYDDESEESDEVDETFTLIQEARERLYYFFSYLFEILDEEDVSEEDWSRLEALIFSITDDYSDEPEETLTEVEYVPNTVPLEQNFEFITASNFTDLPLVGAGFRLYRRVEDGTNWELITDAIESEAVTGVVRLENLSDGGEYRLIETQTPTYYLLPPAGHYWIIHVDTTEDSITLPTHYGNAPAFVERDGNIVLPNNRASVLFSFTKTNEDLDQHLAYGNFRRLEGATFVVRAWCEDTNDWVAIGDGATAVSDPNGLVAFEQHLRIDGRYRLDEIATSAGLRLPAGYWELTWDEQAERFAIEARGTLELVPAFRSVYRSVTTNDIIGSDEVAMYQEAGGEVALHFYVGSFPETALASPGGVGAMSLTAIGILSLTIVVVADLVLSKKKKRAYPIKH